eukprot:scaffold93823_cov67-Phaeocystis_antarctica.AAC.1
MRATAVVVTVKWSNGFPQGYNKNERITARTWQLLVHGRRERLCLTGVVRIPYNAITEHERGGARHNQPLTFVL